MQKAKKSNQPEIMNSFVSHEIKSFLTSAKAYAQLIEYSLKKNNTQKALEQSQKLNLQLDRVADAFTIALDAKRIATNSLQILPEKMSLQIILDELSHRQIFFNCNQRMLTTGIFLSIDLNYTLRTIVHLVRFAKGQSTLPIQMQVSQEKNKCLFSLMYSGDEKIVTDGEKVFEPFYNSHTNSGSDLGLLFYIAKYIFQMQQGDIILKKLEHMIAIQCFLPIYT